MVLEQGVNVFPVQATHARCQPRQRNLGESLFLDELTQVTQRDVDVVCRGLAWMTVLRTAVRSAS